MKSNTTYKQETKDKSRREIWTHAVQSLTSNRNNCRVLREDYFLKLTSYVQKRFDLDFNKLYYFSTFRESVYGQKTPDTLKVAFFCGPEPENDVEVLLSLGVRLENMYAFEIDSNNFKTAVEALEEKYPQLKIFKGNIEHFTQMRQTTFDIVYLDFTSHLFKSYETIFNVLDSNILSPLSVFIVNTCFPPDPNDEMISFIANYFFNDWEIEHSIVRGPEFPNITGLRYEGFQTNGIYDIDKVKEIVKNNFEEAYSAFQTDFINVYANITKPIFEIINNHILRDRLFKTDKIEELLNMTDIYNQLDKEHYNEGMPLISRKLRLNKFPTKMPDKFNKKINNLDYSRIDCMRLFEILQNASYFKYYHTNIENEDNNHKPVIDIPSYLSEALGESSRIVEKILKPGGYCVHSDPLTGKEEVVSGAVKEGFCDLPMIHLWYEMIVNSLGYPYHTNAENHKRHKYIGKKNTMCVDIFTFDQCRAFYDWLPMIEYQYNYIVDSSRQMIIRMCLDQITKHSTNPLGSMYYGSALVGRGSTEWAVFHDFKKREDLNNENKNDKSICF